VLSNESVREQLRADFVSAWVLAKDLEPLAARSDEDLARLCKLLKANYGYPVDSVLVGADLTVRGHVNAHDEKARDADSYLAFLRKGLADAGRTASAVASDKAAVGATTRRKPISDLLLTPDLPTASHLDTFTARGFGQPNITFVPIDATAFANGGTIEVEVRVGSGNASGRFELCTPLEHTSGKVKNTFMQPVLELPAVARETTQKLVHEFAKGDHFGLVVTPALGTIEGETNAFLATVTIRKR
jgi:hypothetical protein